MTEEYNLNEITIRRIIKDDQRVSISEKTLRRIIKDDQRMQHKWDHNKKN